MFVGYIPGMKQISLFLALFLASALSLVAQTNPIRGWSGTLELQMDGFTLDDEQLSHQVFCLDNQDTLNIKYLPASPEGDYVILGCELWGQVSLGEPTMLAQLQAGEPGNPSDLSLPLASVIPAHLLPQPGRSYRIMLRVRRIIEVDGRRYLSHMDVPDEATDFTFLLTKQCQ